MVSLSQAQVRAYRDTGYVMVEHFFDRREVQAMLAELERFKHQGMIRNVATIGDGKTTSATVSNLQVIPLNDKSDLFRALPFAPKVRQAVETLLGGAFVRYLDQIFLKPGKHGAGTRWHQDNAYFKVDDPMHGVGMWIAMHDAHRENGTLEVIPGSHRQDFAYQRDPGSDHHIVAMGVDESQAVPAILSAGGLVFFNLGVAHCTRGNQTDHERAGLAYHFLQSDHVPEEGRQGAVEVSGPNATGGRREYGVDVSEAWTAAVDRLADA